MIIVICNSYAKYDQYIRTTIAQSHAMTRLDFTHICNLHDVQRVISLEANEVRIIEHIYYLSSEDWFDITRRIR